MIIKLFALHDAAVGQFDRPFAARSLAEAERMVLAACREPESHIGKNAADMSCHYLGEFDTESGYINPETPQCIVTSAAFLQHQRQAEHQNQE